MSCDVYTEYGLMVIKETKRAKRGSRGNTAGPLVQELWVTRSFWKSIIPFPGVYIKNRPYAEYSVSMEQNLDNNIYQPTSAANGMNQIPCTSYPGTDSLLFPGPIPRQFV